VTVPIWFGSSLIDRARVAFLRKNAPVASQTHGTVTVAYSFVYFIEFPSSRRTSGH